MRGCATPAQTIAKRMSRGAERARKTLVAHRANCAVARFVFVAHSATCACFATKCATKCPASWVENDRSKWPKTPVFVIANRNLGTKPKPTPNDPKSLGQPCLNRGVGTFSTNRSHFGSRPTPMGLSHWCLHGTIALRPWLSVQLVSRVLFTPVSLPSCSPALLVESA